MLSCSPHLSLHRLTSPSLIFWLLILGGLWLYALKIRTTPFEVAGRELPSKAVIGFLALCKYQDLQKPDKVPFPFFEAFDRGLSASD
jgi:hypothetical protein